MAQHPDIINRFLKAIDEATTYTINHPSESKAILEKRLNANDTFVNNVWNQTQYELSLDESQIMAMEDEGHWTMSNNLTGEKVNPNYRKYFYLNGSGSRKAGSDKYHPLRGHEIKTQVILSIVIFVIALLIIASSVMVTNQRVDRLNKQLELANNIEVGASYLGYLSDDYLLFHEAPQVDVWNTKYASVSNDISNLSVDTPEQQAIVNDIKASQMRLHSVFNDVESNLNNTDSQDGTANLDIVQVSWSRLGVQTQGIVFDSSRLSSMIQDELNQAKQMNSMLISVLLGTFILFLLVDYVLIYGNIMRSISDLRAGTRAIGSGNFDVSLKERNNEVGELANRST